VPNVRGRELYRPLDAILDETRRRAETGAVEVCFVGQTVNSWRHEGKDFSDLLRAAAGLPGVRRLRFMSPHPFFVTDRMARAMADLPQVCPHLHLPVQSGSDRILKLMLPSETEEDFAGTLDLFGRAGFDAAYCFKYSPREGTEAAAMPDDATGEVKQSRLSRLLDRVETRARAKAASLVGRTVEVLLEDPTYGRTEGYYKARFEAPQIGPIVRAEVTGVDGAVLRAAPRELAAT
jgi:tRNA-2-methylthio-N6-dimethylallyladenosine synthase